MTPPSRRPGSTRVSFTVDGQTFEEMRTQADAALNELYEGDLPDLRVDWDVKAIEDQDTRIRGWEAHVHAQCWEPDSEVLTPTTESFDPFLEPVPDLDLDLDLDLDPEPDLEPEPPAPGTSYLYPR